MIKTLIFDIDGTLYDYDAAHTLAYRELQGYAERELGLLPEHFDELCMEANRTLERHSGGGAAIHNRLIRFQLLLEQMGRPLYHAPRMASLYWSEMLSHTRPYPDTRECLERLKAAGYLLGIGTNMTADWQFAKLERMDILEYFDFMVSSEEAGAEKPDARLFDCCAEKAGCAAGCCMFIGDDLRKDARGARQAGMKSVWVCRGEPLPQEETGIRVIRSLSEVPGLPAEY